MPRSETLSRSRSPRRESAASVHDPAGLAAVVPVAPADDREYRRRLRQIAIRERRIEALSAELDALRANLNRFEHTCHARVGDLVAELRRLAAAAADYERRLRRLRVAADAVDDEEPSPFNRWSGDAADPETDAFRRDPSAESAGDRAGGIRTALRRLPAAQLAEAKRLYLDLAKRCHPDRAHDDVDRHRRQELMLRVNEAWRQRDLDALHSLRGLIEADVSNPEWVSRSVADRLKWATAELALLDDRVIDLRAELILLRGGEIHRLWRRHAAGEPVIDQIETDLERRLNREGRRLDALIATYRRLHDERRRSRAEHREAAPAAPATV